MDPGTETVLCGIRLTHIKNVSMATKPSVCLLFCRELFICFNVPVHPILQTTLALLQRTVLERNA